MTPFGTHLIEKYGENDKKMFFEKSWKGKIIAVFSLSRDMFDHYVRPELKKLAATAKNFMNELFKPTPPQTKEQAKDNQPTRQKQPQKAKEL